MLIHVKRHGLGYELAGNVFRPQETGKEKSITTELKSKFHQATVSALCQKFRVSFSRSCGIFIAIKMHAFFQPNQSAKCELCFFSHKTIINVLFLFFSLSPFPHPPNPMSMSMAYPQLLILLCIHMAIYCPLSLTLFIFPIAPTPIPIPPAAASPQAVLKWLSVP